MSSEESYRKKSAVTSAPEAGLDGANGSRPLEDLARVQTKCKRLSEQVQQLEKERDAYQRAVYAYELARITEADLQRYAQHEDGLPLEAFVDELKGSPS